MTNLIKKFKSFSLILLAFGFFVSTAVTSCGNKRGQQEADFQNQDEHHEDANTDFPSGANNDRSDDNPRDGGGNN